MYILFNVYQGGPVESKFQTISLIFIYFFLYQAGISTTDIPWTMSPRFNSIITQTVRTLQTLLVPEPGA